MITFLFKQSGAISSHGHIILKFIYFFRFTFDAMHAVAGAYATPIFVDKLGATPVWFSRFNSFREGRDIYIMLILDVDVKYAI